MDKQKSPSVTKQQDMVIPAGRSMTVHDVQGVATIKVQDRADLTLIYNQSLSEDTFIEEHCVIELGKDSKVTMFLFLQGSASCRLSYDFLLQKEGASAELYGLYVLNDQRMVDISVRQQHCDVHTTSDVVVKGLLFDRAKAYFNGSIVVDSKAHYSKASLQNKNIVLSEYACAISKPCLEVQADAVSCKHGSAVGSLDEEHLFYMQSRGFSKEQAEKILLTAFAQEILLKVPNQSVKDHWKGIVSAANTSFFVKK